MIPNSRALLLPLLLLAACSDARAVESVPAPVQDAPLAAYRAELLDFAFETASSMPTVPHVKNRARAQKVVVDAAFELEQPKRALGYVQDIDTWIRGMGYAEYASYCARRGDAAGAQRHRELAREVYEETEKDEIQDWQRDSIRAAIAEATGSEAIEENLEEALRAVDAAVAIGQFDGVRSALETCARLFDRSYADADERARAEQKIKSSWNSLPVTVRIELLVELTESALDHSDHVKALELLDETRALMDTAAWRPEHEIPWLGRLAGLRARTGAAEKARTEIDEALAAFDAGRDEIQDFRRARVLIPLAETYAALGDAATARSVYARAVEEGSLNINARPRAEDLSATCCSMAVHAIEPDAKLLARMREIRSALADPW